MTSLNKLNLANNSIHTIGKSCWEFTQKIANLNLSSNRLAEVTQNTFELLTKLKYLDLSANEISTITSNAFNATRMILTLDLSQNRISSTIEDAFGAFSSLKFLESLNLMSNNIKTINRNAFLGLDSLTYLDVRSNNVSTVHDGAFSTQTTPMLRQLDMRSDDLICDCNIAGFHRWLSEMKLIGKNISTVNVTCSYPFEVRGLKLMQLSESRLICSKCIVFSFLLGRLTISESSDETPNPRLIDEPKSSVLAIKGTDMALECTVVLTAVNTDVAFQWKHDNADIDGGFVERRERDRDELLGKIREKLIERRRKANRSPTQTNISAPKVPLASSSISKLKEIEEDDEETDDVEFGNSGEDDFIDEDDKNSLEEQIKIVSNLPANSTIVSSILNLRSVDRKHMGRYQCIASNKFGSTYSKRFRVSVACECNRV